MKSWVLHRVQGLGGIAGRADLAPRERGHGPALDDDRGPATRDDAVGNADALRPGGDLGVYAPLIGALHDELAHFVASHVRLHVTIADRDRFLLTSIGVRSPGSAAARELLQQFLHEFKPEQVKRYLAREVIGRLPNAGVLDLALFGGLDDLDAADGNGDDDGGEYRELLAALRTTPADAATRPYEVTVLGRWTEADAASLPFVRADRHAPTPATPLAGRSASFAIGDAGGTRVAVLHGVVAGRRYAIGKEDACDLRANGTYTSRRHAELWFEDDGWRVADAGSTNGIRVVDAETGRTLRTSAETANDDAPIKLDAGMRVVLSARAEGPAGDYPWIALHAASAAIASAPAPATPIAAAPKTPLTAVLAVQTRGPRFDVALSQASGEQVMSLAADALPFTIGRSRDQSLVVDRVHAGVSGHHVVIDAIDDDGVSGIVEGDNGIAIDDAGHASGARFAWRPGQALVLGGSLPGESRCTLVLARSNEGSR